MKYKPIRNIRILKTRRKTFILTAMLLVSGMAQAQILIEGNVYGGGNIGEVVKTTDGTGNTSVIVNGGTIGDTLRLKHRVADKQMQVTTRVDYGNVYGGGNGYKIIGHNANNNAPIFDINAGRVQGNTSVYVGGDAVVRRAVYGGGNMASVGIYTANNGVATYTSGGHTVVTVTGNALIGPKKTDLTSPTPAELDSARAFYNKPELSQADYIDSAFKYLGANEGWVFGSSRGISGGLLRDHSFVDTTEVTISGNAQVLNVFGSGENGHVQKGTNVIVGGNAIVGGVPLHDAGEYQVPASEIADNPGEYSGASYTLVVKDSETAEDEFGMGREIPRGNVLGGGKGTDFISWFANPKFCYTSGRVYGNTHVTIQDNALIYNRVYGGGLISMVGTFTEEESQDPDNHTVIGIESGGHTYVNINGGIIGSPGSDGHNNGEVYGGSRGLPGRPRKMVSGVLETLTPLHQVVDEAYVGHTHVTVDGGTVMNNVYGGGANGHVQGNTYVTIKETDSNKRTTIGLEGVGGWHGNVYAGGGGTDRYTEDNAKKFSITAGRVFGNTNLNITGGTIMHNVYGGGALASVGPLPTTDYDPGTSTCTVNINGGTIGQVVTPTSGEPYNYGGNVYGAGRGIINELAPLTQFASASNAVVNVNNGSGTVVGNVYGGGSYGQVKQETNVNMIGGSVEGSVFGGGMGIETEEIAGLVKGNATVDMRGGTVKRSVYGGGQMGSVGTFVDATAISVNYLADPDDPESEIIATVKVPTECEEGTGLTTVKMSGGSVGLNGSLMPWEDHNPDDDDRGWIFCGGQGVADSITYPKAIALGVVNCTHLQINNSTSGENIITPVITASVYGGAENGLVLDSTFVEIAGGQIGTGLKSKSTVGGELVGTFDGIYTEQNWSTAITAINNGTIETALGTSGSLNDIFHECDAWEYGDNDGNIKVYDINYGEHIIPDDPNSALYEPEITALQGTNGHSFFGNVFGGGSGYYPIAPGVWRPTAGQVNGNTRVEITGGHILTAVYGGNETTDVKGESTIKMNGGTVGIPRTKASIQARPVNGNIFGAGMGDPRTMFNAMTNVKKTQVYLTGGTVFGNVYGGSREGHVLDSTLVVIRQGTLIGTTGFSGYDGLVFGGGRGKDQLLVSDTLGGRRQFPVGRVGGNTHVTMSQGKVLGNIYGGGQVGLVGVDEDGWITSFVQGAVYDSIHHGLSKVEVSGGTIGNLANNGDDLLRSDQAAGNVYGGGRGDLDEYVEDDLGRVAKSIVNISGDPDIYGSVFGGGQMANVGYWIGYGVGYAKGTSGSGVNIIGSPKIGTAHEFGLYDPDYQKTQYDTINGMRMISHTRTGNVFGGGQGNVQVYKDNNDKYHVVGLEHGHCGKTTVSIGMNNGTSGGQILGSVFGGSEQGAIWGDTKVTVTGGTIGKEEIVCDTLKYVDDNWVFFESDSTYSYGSVYGGSYGADAYRHFHMDPSNLSPEYQRKVDSVFLLGGRVYGNTFVEITGGAVRGNVFGGGDMASVGEWDANFIPVSNTGKATVNVSGSAIVGPLDGTGLNAYVFGGGKGIGNDPDNLRKKYCNLNSTEVTVSLGENGRVFGSLYGGGSDAHTLGDTHVKLLSGTIGTEGVTLWDGNIFGGGRNLLLLTYAAGRVGGNTSVEMMGGNVLGSVYGGGRNGLTGFSGDVISTGSNTYQALPDNQYGHATVKVSGGTVGNLAHMRDSDFSIGNVYGGGKGSKTGIDGHPASSAMFVSLVKDTEVEISGTARIYGNVYGGGELSSVGNFTWKQNVNAVSEIAIAESTGHTKVTVSGGTIGMDNMQMITESGYPDDFGHVFGGGEGWVESPDSPTNPVIDSEGNHLVECMASVRTTEVTISDEAFVLGSVYGGSNNGHVLDSTWVKIQGGQIGAGENVVDANGHNRPYTDNEWNSASLAECASWTYQEGGNPYDINILNPVTNKPEPGMNGATFYGHVFGGGSGFYPYGVDDDGNSQWLRSSGQVKGNTRVEVTDGHILTSLYGGCETTDVGTYTYDNNIHGEVHVSGGKSTVIVSGGTIGVPHDSTSIVNHPVTCHVYGSGKGDPRFFFNTWTNVWDSKVEIKGTAWVYGSVFGGGEEGHVLNNVDLDVSENAKIGTLGYTNVDGNVFGGGRGFTGWALTAGSVGGNIDIDITGGTMLGSVYGGGRLASVGTYLVEKDIPDPENPSQTVINPFYGRFQPGDNHGFIDINISGGTIGNDHEIEKLTHAKPDTKGGNVYGGCMGKFVEKTGDDTPIWPSLARAKKTNVTITGTVLVKNSVYGGGEIGTLSNNATVNISGGTIGGNYGTGNFCGHVFGGGRGIDDPAISLNAENDSTLVAGYLAGRVYGNTTVNISGGQVYENVCGGGEVASVGWVKDDGTMVNGLAQVNMTGGIIGPFDDSGLNGHIFGGPKGGNNASMKEYCNVNNTEVNVGYTDIDSNRVWGSLFGGGSDGHVLGNAMVNVTNGTIGTSGITSLDGNVYGGGRNFHEVSETAGRVGGNTTVNILGGHMLGSVFGGGRLGSVGIDVNGDTIVGPAHGYTTVNVGGQFQIGDINFVQTGNIDIGHQITDPSHPDERVGGNVYGGAKGKAGAPGTLVTRVSKVKQTTVNIRGKDDFKTWIEGSVFGSGEDGHVLKDTYVNIFDGQIGGHDYGDFTPCADPYHGNVYGGGRGVDTYEDPEHPGTFVHSTTAGWVQGNTNVNMYGGHVIRNVYGGGNLASVGNPDEQDPQPGQDYKTGLASVTITGGTVGTTNEDENFGNVFGSAHGGVSGEYVHLAFVKNTHVTIGQTAQIYGSVFGGGEDGHVRKNTLVDIEGGIIGDGNDVANHPLDGNVYGGGRGLLINGNSESAGEVYGYTTVNIKNSTDNGTNYSPEIWNNVFGGGSQSVVQEYKVVNVSGGLVHGNVFGGSREIPTGRQNFAPRWVNMWDGTVEGSVFGCSYKSDDGNPLLNEENPGHTGTDADNKGWASFVNLSGGTVNGSVYGAGYQGEVKGSVGVLIGKNAIEQYSTLVDADSLRPSSVTKAPLDIKGNVYAGSNFLGSQSPQPWRTFDITGYSNVYIDGKGYKTGTTGSDPEMIIRGGLFGSGTNCESGAAGRDIVIRNYGERDMYHAPSGGKNSTSDSLVSVTRTFTTIQRVGNLFLDKANIALTGARDISNLDGQPNTYYGVYQVDTSMVVSNGSSIVLGNAADPTHIVPAYIDSVKVLRSVRLDESIYAEFFLPKLAYTWIGVKDTREDIGLDVNFYYNGEETPLDRETQENVIIFKGLSQLFVRYHIGSENQYGELQGFFRMSSPYKPRGTESFAYARQKVASAKDDDDPNHLSDGGFASYYSPYNFFTDNGEDYTKTKQYPYTNIISDPVLGECRGWFIPDFGGHYFYVDGTGTRKGDNDVLAIEGGGRFPDMPKLTIVGSNDPTTYSYSIMGDASMGETSRFNSETDIIYVVGAVSGVKELVGNTSGKLGPNASHSTLPLRLYRYPGGHLMSNGFYDYGPSGEGTTKGPGPWYGTMLSLDNEGEEADQTMTNKTLVLDSVMIDGLYGVTNPAEIQEHEINVNVPSTSFYHDYNTTDPLATVNKGTLLMKGNTELKRGYNNHDASANVGTAEAPNYNFYVNPDFDNSVINGGGVYVAPDASANVQVEGIVTITGNKQKKGNGTIESNVYLPTFQKHIEITNQLDPTAVIGVTSPNRNTDKYFWDNTLSPVAKGVRLGSNETSLAVLDAKAAWTNNNFRDDQNWFFSNGDKDTYYLEPYTSMGSYQGDGSSVYFGWTWGNVVRTQPSGYVAIGDNITISSEEGLAWLISQTTDLNGAPLTNFSGKTISLAQDLNLKQYVWVPVGSEIGDANNRKFSGTFDGRGHLIDSLAIEFLSKTDRRYQRSNYGLFGDVNNGRIDRTFVVRSVIVPDSISIIIQRENPPTEYNIGGLAGYLEGTSVVSNSEAAITIRSCVTYKAYAGGLVGELKSGEIHSSMAMPEMTIKAPSMAGGLVGKSSGGSVNNSFVNAKFVFRNGGTGGGLLGTNGGTKVRNCYVALYGATPDNTIFDGLAKTQSAGSIDSCYVQSGYTFANSGSFNKNFTPVSSTDTYGYMYLDNTVPITEGTTNVINKAMFQMLNHWVDKTNKTTQKYAHWTRPTLHSINGDLPVLMLCNYDGTGEEGQGDFRSLATFKQGVVLQYGGTVRDGSEKELSTMLGRTEDVLVYGDILEDLKDVQVNATKVAIYEHAAILKPGKLGSSDNTYVGVTFDNTSRSAVDAYGDQLGRDWHMFSSPLQNAPLGINYSVNNGEDQNENGVWNEDNPENNRYVYNYWTGDVLPAFHFYSASEKDGYLPSTNPAYNPETDKYKYPYDFYCWYEPDWQWINFKRNGVSHWHFDFDSQHDHPHIDYQATPSATPNRNEEFLVKGKGYQIAIEDDTYLQSHGNLNKDNVIIDVTNTGGGWGVGPLYFGNNLIGNPYHAYLDFNAFGSYSENKLNSFYVYDADTAAKRHVDYLIYPDGGSTGGCYASRYIHPHQGFFVQYKPEDTDPPLKTLTFTPSMTVTRKDVENAGFRDEQPAYPLVNLFAYDWENKGDVLVVEFNRPENGGGIKSKSLRNGNHLVFAHHGDDDYGAFFAKEGTKQVPVRFQSFEKEKKPYTFRWNLQNGDFRSLYLIDNMTGIQYDMLRNDSYSFEASKQDYLSRFLIVFDVTDVEEHSEDINFAFFDGSSWVVNGKGRLEVVDVLGRILHAETLHGDQNRVNLDNYAKGIYLLRLWEGDTPKIQKIIMH